MDFFRGFVTILVSCGFCSVYIPSGPIAPALMDIDVLALGGRLMLAAMGAGDVAIRHTGTCQPLTLTITFRSWPTLFAQISDIQV